MKKLEDEEEEEQRLKNEVASNNLMCALFHNVM